MCVCWREGIFVCTKSRKGMFVRAYDNSVLFLSMFPTQRKEKYARIGRTLVGMALITCTLNPVSPLFPYGF